jgi:hypothetical protein
LKQRRAIRVFIAAALTLTGVATAILVIPAFRARVFRQTLVWPDRRPIASLVLATSGAGWSKNPRGWFIDPSVDVTTKDGLERFHQRVLKWADTSIAVMRSMGAQGMVTWDIEGEQYPQRTSYIGDPRLVNQLAPEMTGVIDEYFRRFRMAGFRVGVTVRPQQLVVAADGKSARQELPGDPAKVLVEKIQYAKARWGATLFYVDSNRGSSILARVASAVPGILLIPEHARPRYFAITAPYSDLRDRIWGTPRLIRWLYPGCFSVIYLADGDLAGKRDEIVRQLAEGNVAMFRGWFPDPANHRIRELLDRSGR